MSEISPQWRSEGSLPFEGSQQIEGSQQKNKEKGEDFSEVQFRNPDPIKDLPPPGQASSSQAEKKPEILRKAYANLALGLQKFPKNEKAETLSALFVGKILSGLEYPRSK